MFIKDPSHYIVEECSFEEFFHAIQAQREKKDINRDRLIGYLQEKLQKEIEQLNTSKFY